MSILSSAGLKNHQDFSAMKQSSLVMFSSALFPVLAAATENCPWPLGFVCVLLYYSFDISIYYVHRENEFKQNNL